MTSYSLAFKKYVTKDLSSIFNNDLKRTLKRIDLLRENSFPKDWDFRFPLTFTIVYEIQNTELIVFIVKVAHRSEVYKIT